MIFRVLITCAFAPGLIHLAGGTSAERLEDDTRGCGWRVTTTLYNEIYDGIETRLARAKPPKEDIDGMYMMVADETRTWRSDLNARKNSVMLGAFTQFDLAQYLDVRNCYDHCTYVLAKNNCNAAISLHACRSRSNRFSYVKLMLDAKVFPLVERCHIPLMAYAVALNTTNVPRDLYGTVDYITEQMIDFEPSLWHKIEDLALMDAKPFLTVRRIVRPVQAGFFTDITDLMLELDRRTPQQELHKAASAGQFLAPEARMHFHRLIVKPCQDFIDKMHTAMDATIFYGRMIDLDKQRFALFDTIADATKVAYFRLAKMYEACTHLDEGDFFIRWRVEARKLAARVQQPS